MSGPKCNDFSVKKELAEFFALLTARECVAEVQLALIEKHLIKFSTEATRIDINERHKIEISSLREFAAPRYETHIQELQVIKAHVQQQKNALNAQADSLIKNRKFDEAASLIRNTGQEEMNAITEWTEKVSIDTKNVARAFSLSEITHSVVTPVRELRPEAKPEVNWEATENIGVREEEARRQALYNQRYEELTLRYNSLLKMKNREPIAMTDSTVSVDKKRMQALQKQIDNLQNELVKDRQQQYINETLDRLLRGMGHNVVGSHNVLKNKLYRYNQGTAIKASFSSNGEVVMEVVGLSDGERRPTNDEAVTFLKDMETFCAEYAGIKEQLDKMGIQTERVYERGVDKKYAKMENLNNYRTDPGVSIEELFTDAQQQTQNTRKVMHLG